MNLDDLDIELLRRRRGAKWANVPADVIPAWVADMDFPVAEPIARVLAEMVRGCDLGYPSGPRADGLATIFARRMQERFGWSVDPARVEVITDVVQGLHLAVSVFSEPGDAVVTPLPIYPPFLEAVRANNRVPVWKHFVSTSEGFRIDFDRLRAELPAATRMLLVCNPHNPTGRVLSAQELRALADLALERDLIVVSDEIHADLVYDGRRHLALATLGPEIAARTITLTSATKAFNIAGLRCSIAVFGTAELHRRFRAVHAHARGGIGILGMAASAAAWSEGQPWQDEVVRYLEGNRDLVAEHVRGWKGVVHAAPEATYLAWLDFRALGPDPSPQAFFLEHARVALSEGLDFGESGRGFARLNFATSRPIVREILARMDEAMPRR
ncbi:MAG: MalY/PatB family protein [Candidatus Binatia bacterium]